jgi:hypothetical protein
MDLCQWPVDLGKLDSSTLRPIYGDGRSRQLTFGNNWRRGFALVHELRAAGDTLKSQHCSPW